MIFPYTCKAITPTLNIFNSPLHLFNSNFVKFMQLTVRRRSPEVDVPSTSARVRSHANNEVPSTPCHDSGQNIGIVPPTLDNSRFFPFPFPIALRARCCSSIGPLFFSFFRYLQPCFLLFASPAARLSPVRPTCAL